MTQPVVAIYRTQILPLSETFVRDQALFLRRWRPVLVGERRIDALDLTGVAVAAQYHGPPTTAQRLRGFLFRKLGITSPTLTAMIRRFKNSVSIFIIKGRVYLWRFG